MTVMNGNAGYRVANRKRGSEQRPIIDDGETRTDHKRWRLLDEGGRQRWMYLKSKEEAEQWPQTIADKYHLGMTVVSHVGPSDAHPHDIQTSTPTKHE